MKRKRIWRKDGPIDIIVKPLNKHCIDCPFAERKYKKVIVQGVTFSQLVGFNCKF